MKECLVPHYHEKFQCTAENCLHNCCKGGWLIELSDEIVEKYKAVGGEIGKQLCESVTTDEEGCPVFCMQNGACPHLEENGLCRVCRELGEEYMGVVCREFPRFFQICGDHAEAGIGLACEEAARIILSEKQPFSLKRTTVSKAGLAGDWSWNEEESEKGYLEFLKKARTYMFDLLWKAKGTVFEKIQELLDFSQCLQRHVNCGNYAETDDFSKKMPRIFCEEEWDEDLCRETKKLLMDIYRNLEQLDEMWISRADAVEECLLKGTYRDALLTVEGGECMQLQLLSYFLYRYFMKSAHDYNVSDKIRLCVCDFVLLMAQFAAAGESGGLTLGRLVEEARIFSRQVEYSENNTELLLEEFNFGDELSESRIKLMLFK